jgi:dihydrofolate reductase
MNRGKVTTGFSMSLDGFVAGPNEDFQQLFSWMASGDTEYTLTIGKQEQKLKIASESIERFEDAINTTGALVCGRRLYELTHGWDGHHPIGAPVVVVTHRPRPDWAREEWPVVFVTDGLESAIEQAQAIAGGKTVTIASATIVQQCLNAGLLDEIHIDLVPFLLGDGVRLFEHLKVAPIPLEDPHVSVGKGVLHLTYPLKRSSVP